MKNIILTIVALIALTTGTVFATEPTPVKDVQFGWGPSAVASVGAFYLNGNYKLLSAGFNVGTAYTFEGTSAQNIDSVGFYLGPRASRRTGSPRSRSTRSATWTSTRLRPAGSAWDWGRGSGRAAGAFVRQIETRRSSCSDTSSRRRTE